MNTNLKAENNWQPDFDALEAMNTTKVKLMWIKLPAHAYRGRCAKETFERLIRWARERDILLINDNPYSFILNNKPESILSIPGAKEVALELNSLSKAFNMAGWRIGMLSGKAATLKAVLKVKSNMDSGMFYGIQQGAIAALNVESGFEELNSIYRRRRNKVEDLATQLGTTFNPQSVGMFVWAKLPKEPLIRKLI